MTVLRGGHPIPRQQFIEPIDLVIVDAVDALGEWIETVQLCHFNNRHRPRQGFRAGIGAREESVLPSYSDRAQGAFGGIVVDGHTPVSQEQAEGVVSGKSIA